MSDKENNEQDVLKKLREVRRKLQESLSEDSASSIDSVSKAETQKILVDGQADIEKQDKARMIQAKSEGIQKKPRLYKAGESPKKQKSPKKLKKAPTTTGLSAKKMAGIQKRIQSKVAERQSMSNKRKALLIIALVVAATPFLFITSLSLVTCEFDTDNIEFDFDPSAVDEGFAEATLYMPIHNPSIFPATIGSIKLEIYGNGGNHIGDVLNYDTHTIQPKGDTRLSLTVAIDKNGTSGFLTDLFETWNITLSLVNFEYNGIQMPGGIKIPEMSIMGLLEDFALGSLDLASMLDKNYETIEKSAGYLSELDNYGEIMYDMTGYNPETGAKDLWKYGKYTGKIQGIQASADDESDMYIDITESSDSFSANVSMPLELDAMDEIDLGVVKVWDLSIGLYVNTSYTAGETVDFGYDYPLIQIQTMNSSDPNKEDVYLDFGGAASEANVFLNISKDTGFVGEHPSATVDWDDPVAMAALLENAPQELPMFNFLYNLLVEHKLDCLIAIDSLSVEVMGLKIENINIPRTLIEPFKDFSLDQFLGESGVALDLGSFLDSSPVISPMGAVGLLCDLACSGGLNFPTYLDSLSSTPGQPMASRELDLDSIDVEEILDMSVLDADALMNSIVEVPGESITLNLGLGINAFPIDLTLGFTGMKLELGTKISDSQTIYFGEVTIQGNNSDTVYFGGYNSSAYLNITAKLYTDQTRGQGLAFFLRQILEEYTINVVASASIDKIVLFQENMTIPGISVIYPFLDDEMLGDTIDEAIADSLEGVLAPEEVGDLSASESLDADCDVCMDNNAIDDIALSGNPFLVPYEFPLALALNNPVMDFLLTEEGKDWASNGLETSTLEAAISPESSGTDISITATTSKISVEVGLTEFEELAGVELPISVGVGAVNFRIQGKNQYDNWQDIMVIKVPNMLELGSEDPVDLYVTVDIMTKGPICDFLYDFIDEGVLNIKLDGYLSVVLSGVVIDGLHLSLPIEGIDTGFNFVTTVAMAIDALREDTSGEQNAFVLMGGEDSEENELEFWNGDMSMIPFVSEDTDIGDFFEMGDFFIYELSETGWPYVDQGEVIISVGVELTNYLVELGIGELNLSVWTADPLEPASKNLINIYSEGQTFSTGVKKELILTVTITKSQELQDMLSQATELEFDGLGGWITAKISLNLFGCSIGPIEVGPDKAVDITQFLTPSFEDIIEACIPFSYSEEERNDPNAAVEVDEIIGKYGGLYVRMDPDDYNPSAGPQNWDEPLIDVRAGLCLAPGLNMSILDTELYLLDSNIYNAIYDSELGNREEAEHYSLMGALLFEPGDLYFNSTKSNPDDFYNQEIDTDKPWYDKVNDTIYYQDPGLEGVEPYGLGTYFQFEASVRIYNLSYGTYETRYPKHLWSKLGGPYFPVQVYGPEYGGYPDHRVEYHEYFSPAQNILGGVLNGFNMDDLQLDGALSNIKVGGQITLNLFSMNISLDLGGEAIGGLIDDVMGMAELGIVEYTQQLVNPFGAQPISSFCDENGNANKFSLEPTLPEASEGFDNLAIDINSFLNDLKIGGLLERNDHLYCPQYGEWGGTSVSPLEDGYVGGLYDANDPSTFDSSNIETFVKDYHYTEFKALTENYRQQMDMSYNPYFETFDEEGNVIEDPEDWPLRYDSLTEDRIRTNALTAFIAVSVHIPIGILSGFLPLWIDGEQPCTITPFGYMWINESVNLIPIDEEDPDWENWYENSDQIDENGKPPEVGYYLAINLRGFEGLAYNSFLKNIMHGLNFQLILSGRVNVSLFGYEIYDINFEPMELGDPTYFYDQCEEWKEEQEEGGYIYDIPTTDDLIGGAETEIPPDDFIPEFDDYDWGTVIDLNTIVAGLFGQDPNWWDYTTAIVELLRENIDISFNIDGLCLEVQDLELNALVAVAFWIEFLDIEVYINTVEADDAEDIPDNGWRLIDSLRIEEWIELASYDGSNTDPYDFTLNTMKDMSFKHTWTIPSFEVTIPYGDVIDFIFGSDKNFIKLGLTAYIGAPPELDFNFDLRLDQDMLTFDL